jgi:transcriptional regulator with XRE-family HTH domain
MEGVEPAVSAPAKAWEEDGYGEIVGVESGAGRVLVGFANGDQVDVDVAALGVDEQTAFHIDEEGGGLIAETSQGEREIDWMLIRRIDDPDFASVVRERDAEESRRIGTRLRVLRENSGLLQKDAAELAGMAAPQLAKIESGKSDLRISTVRSVLRALGASFADISGPDALEVSIKELERNAEKAGAPRELLKRIADKVGARELAPTLGRGFAWDPAALISGVPENRELDFAVAFKARSPDRERQSPLLRLARTVSEICDQTFEGPVVGLPADPNVIRERLIGNASGLSLKTLVDWAWKVGIIVIPMSGPGFSAAAWHVGERPVVILKAKQEFSAHWLFQLAHEIGHLALGHASGDDWIVDVDQPQPGVSTDDDQEQEANEFALALLVPEREQLLEEIRAGSGQALHEQKLWFKGEVERLADERGLAPGLLGFVAAYGLPDVAETGDRWGSATNLAKQEADARPIVRSAFEQKIKLDGLSELDAALVEAVVLE